MSTGDTRQFWALPHLGEEKRGGSTTEHAKYTEYAKKDSEEKCFRVFSVFGGCQRELRVRFQGSGEALLRLGEERRGDEPRNTQNTRKGVSEEKCFPLFPIFSGSFRTSDMKTKLLFKEESYKIVGACFEVYREKGCGFLEPVYQECLEIEFRLLGIQFVAQKALSLEYKGSPLRTTYEPDFVCYEKIIVELKAVKEMADEHRAQVQNYLKATGFQLGLLVNFGHYPKLELERIANTRGRFGQPKES